MARPSRWIPPSEAASLLDVSVETVRAWCRRLEAGEKAPIKRVRRLEDGSLLVSRREIWKILRKSRS